MKSECRQFLYHATEEPRIFEEGEDIPNGWADHPDRTKPIYKEIDEDIPKEIDDLESLREEYKSAYGRYPHGKMSKAKIKESIDASE